MRVVFVTHYSSLYGANRSLLCLTEGLKEFGIESFVLCPSNGDVVKVLKERSIPFSVLPFSTWIGESRLEGLRRSMRNFKALPFLIRQVRQWNADLIYTNSSATPVGALIARALHKPHVWHIREFVSLHYQQRYDWGEGAFKYFLNKADAVIAISRAVKEVILDGLHAKTYVIYNGVISKAECETLRKKSRSFNSPSKYNFAIVGAISPNKGQEQAIRALGHIKKDWLDIRLIIAGGGWDGYIDHLKELCEKLGVNEQVEFLGYVSDPFEVYMKADAVLMCSKYEAMGRVTAEAMATAKPVIGFNSGGTPEIIENEVTGLLYEGNYENLAGCMVRFLENPKWAREMGISGWEKARREYTIEVYAKNVHEVLRQVI